jgi:hypothetical protein
LFAPAVRLLLIEDSVCGETTVATQLETFNISCTHIGSAGIEAIVRFAQSAGARCRWRHLSVQAKKSEDDTGVNALINAMRHTSGVDFFPALEKLDLSWVGSLRAVVELCGLLQPVPDGENKPLPALKTLHANWFMAPVCEEAMRAVRPGVAVRRQHVLPRSSALD